MRGQLPVDTTPASGDATRWRDPRLSPAQRAEALIVVRNGLGRLALPFGTAPIDPVLGAHSLQFGPSGGRIVAAVPLCVTGEHGEDGHQRRLQAPTEISCASPLPQTAWEAPG